MASKFDVCVKELKKSMIYPVRRRIKIISALQVCLKLTDGRELPAKSCLK